MSRLYAAARWAAQYGGGLHLALKILHLSSDPSLSVPPCRHTCEKLAFPLIDRSSASLRLAPLTC
jgi:hypothetical protein